MKKISFSWILSIGGVLLVIGAVIFGLSGSLWFLYALLGDNPGHYTIGYHSGFLQSNEVAKTIHNQIASSLPDVVGYYNRFVYQRGDRGEYIVGIPSLVHQISLESQLRQRSWEVRRIGWIVIARRTQANTEPQELGYNLSRAIRKTLHAVFVERLSAQAQLIFQAERSPHNPIALYVDQKDATVHIAIQTNSTQFRKGRAERADNNSAQREVSHFALQRELLSLLPNSFQDSLESAVARSLGFSKTLPNILEDTIALSPSLSIATKNDSLAIGVTSNDDKVAQQIQEWMHLEQGTRHPVKKAFALPDRTIGYEYIPGESNARYSLNKDKNNCLSSEKYEEQLYLCGKGSLLVVSTEDMLGAHLLRMLEDPVTMQRGIIQGSVLEAIDLSSQFDKIEYIISEDAVEVWADAKMQQPKHDKKP